MREQSFELELDVSATDGGHRIEARSGVGGECVADTELAPGDLLLEQRLQRLRLALLSSAATTRRVPSTDEKSVQQLGAELFDRLFVGDVRTLFDTTRQQAAQQDHSVRLVLRIRSPELAALPWEFLYDARRDDYLSLSMPLVRYPEILETVRPLRVAPPLRILSMSSGPAGFDRLDVDAEKAQLQHALSHLARDCRIELTWVSGETWRDLLHALNRGRWHVLHFIAHGGFDTVAGEGVFYMPGEDGSTYCLKASRLAQVVNLHSSLRLILLNSCESALASSTDLFSSSAATLIRRGIPAVLAMQFEISDDAAIEFTGSFYEGVAFGQPIDLAVRDARLALSLARPNSLEWGTPVLYLRQSDGQIFDVTPAQAPATPKQAERPRPLDGPADRRQETVSAPNAMADRPRPMDRLRSRQLNQQSGQSSTRVQAQRIDVSPARVKIPGHSGHPPAAPGNGGWRRFFSDRRHVLVATAAAVVCTLATLLIVLVVAANGGHPAKSAVVQVEANQRWTNSGVYLRAGQQYEIKATGQVSSVPDKLNGPDGDTDRRNDPLLAPMNQANFGALIARIGNRMAPFVVGRGVSGRAVTAGELSLGLNDSNPDDNTGNLTVKIMIFD